MSLSTDIAIVFATLVGPVLAVQAQKWVERARKRSERKEWIFHILMTNRRHRYSAQTLPALNSIDLAFGSGLGRKRQSIKDHAVTEKWQQMLIHFEPNPRMQENDPRLPAWLADSDRLYFELIECMSKALGYKFDISELKRGGYLPESVATAEDENQAVRRAVLNVFQGNAAIKVIARPANGADVT